MVLNKYRGTAERLLSKVARAFSGLHPNTISAVSLIFALLAGIAFVFADKSSFEDIFKPGHYIFIMLAIASICIFLNGFLDAVDGFVARMTNLTSKRGDLFDHALDRYADILIIGGIMLSPFCDTVLGALALIAVLMTSYMGTQAQALGCGRDYSGLLGRADRLVILIVAPLLQMWVSYHIPSGRLPLPGMFSLTILEYTMIWFFIAGNITAIHRGIHAWRELRDQEEPQKRLDHYFELRHENKVRANPSQTKTQLPNKITQQAHKTLPRHPLQYIPPIKTKPRRRTTTKPAKKTKTKKAEVEWDDLEPEPGPKVPKKTKGAIKTRAAKSIKHRTKQRAQASAPEAGKTKSTRKTKLTQKPQPKTIKNKPKQAKSPPKPKQQMTVTKTPSKTGKTIGKTTGKTRSVLLKKTKLQTKVKGQLKKAGSSAIKPKTRLTTHKVKR